MVIMLDIFPPEVASVDLKFSIHSHPMVSDL